RERPRPQDPPGGGGISAEVHGCEANRPSQAEVAAAPSSPTSPIKLPGPPADRLTGTSLPSAAATPLPKVLANSSESTRIAHGIGHLRPPGPRGAPHPPRSPGAPSAL